MSKSNYSIIVTTSDRYVGLIRLFFYYLEMYWGIGDKEIIVVGETTLPKINGTKIKSITYGKKINWSNQINLALKQVKSTYVFVMMEDAFLLNKVNINEINKLTKIALSNDLDYLRFSSTKNDNYNLEFGLTYNTVSIVFGLWKREFLMKNIRTNEDAWEFELNALYRFRLLKARIMTVSLNPLSIPRGGVIIKGKINPTINYDEVFESPRISFHWNNIDSLRTSNSRLANLITRMSKIAPRYLKLIINLTFNRFK